MNIIIPEATHRLLKLLTKFSPGGYASEVLRRTENRIEVAFPLRNWFDKNWNINYEEVEKLKRQEDNGEIQTHSIFHGLYHFNPLRPRYRINLASKQDYLKNLRILKSEIMLASLLKKEGERKAILVNHLGFQEENDLQSSIDIVGNIILEALRIACDRNIHLSFETENIDPRGNKLGAHLGDLARIVETINNKSKRLGFSDGVSITFDVSHSLISERGDYNRLESGVRRYGELIRYAHVGHPKPRLRFDYTKVPKNNSVIHSLPRKLLRIASIEDSHSRIFDIPNEGRFWHLIRVLLEDTRINETGTINMEITWRGAYVMFPKMGASSREILKSYALLKDFLDKYSE